MGRMYLDVEKLSQSTADIKISFKISQAKQYFYYFAEGREWWRGAKISNLSQNFFIYFCLSINQLRKFGRSLHCVQKEAVKKGG